MIPIILIAIFVVVVATYFIGRRVHEPIVVEAGICFYLGIGGITIFPWIFVYPAWREKVLPHETVHWPQQRRWFLRAAVVGLFTWFALYVLVLPVLWNPFRRKWETEAFREGDGLSDNEIDAKLRGWPYLLRW